ncbi:DUF4386 domain-containing protein [Agromyces aerolatus]|uniref:DUF4386 domain-containing protein n=1 Tax=Agromyces sp. LY-1074 TaxID=3074080 RepID=UPI00285C2038|nr:MULTISPECIES: DUF4386 domain-containing protein [unclassified Agromyces]MDR5700996.1 DUF4386 domain-containing protein [Agromyces sp. LY-1074]MDR5707636.1 DUF4386 domain-containing protein [Agromyces sp. LY-1358]
MNRSPRRLLIAGLLFALTFVSAIVGAALYVPVLTDPGYVLGPGADGVVIAGALCELVLIAANIGTALALFPMLRRASEPLALGYVAARLVECTFIAVGILSVLTIVTLRSGPTAADPGALIGTSAALVALHDWTFLLGPGFVVGIGNGLMLGFLMWRARLMPAWLCVVAMIGGPILTVSGVAVMFGGYEQTSVWSGLATLPEIVWEASLAILLTVRGIRAMRESRRAGAATPAMQTPAIPNGGR